VIFSIGRLVLKTIIFAEDLPRRIDAARREAEHERRMRDDATYRDEYNRQQEVTRLLIAHENRRRARRRGLCWFWWMTGMVPFLVVAFESSNLRFDTYIVLVHAGEFGFAMWLITRVVLSFLKYSKY